MRVQANENYKKYHPTKEARFRGSFKTDENEEIIHFQRGGMNADIWVLALIL
jgi:hypothetical protein